jgi:hypothetical protein
LNGVAEGLYGKRHQAQQPELNPRATTTECNLAIMLFCH